MRALPGDEFLLASVTSAKATSVAPVEATSHSQRLDRSNDGQDHTFSPYAFSAVRRVREAARSRGSSRPARVLPHRRWSRPPQPDPRLV